MWEYDDYFGYKYFAFKQRINLSRGCGRALSVQSTHEIATEAFAGLQECYLTYVSAHRPGFCMFKVDSAFA